jgi:alpha-L-rhamnosidase
MSGGRPAKVRFEHLGADVLGIGDASPRLSWRAPAPGGEASELRATWRDGRIEVHAHPQASGLLVAWPWAPLVSREAVHVQVRVRSADGWSAWSEPSVVEAGLLEQADWSARFVGPPARDPDAESALPLVRSPEIAIDGELVAARVYATAHGVFELEVDGARIGDEELEPGWQSYRHRLRYRAHDITALVAGSSSFRIGAMLGEGWYRGRLGFPLIVRDHVYGDELAVLVQVELRFADGRLLVIGSDADWTWLPGPIIASDLYDGETFDARQAVEGWSSPGPVAGERPVEVRAADAVRLVAPTGPPVRRTQELAPVARVERPGSTLLDFGQNVVGRVRVEVDGAEGEVVELRHAEVLDGGELARRPLRTAEAVDRYVLDGSGRQSWEPRFTYHGFRHVELVASDDVRAGAVVTAVVLHSDLERRGWFTSSDPMVNRLHANVDWSMRGNFVDIPTDCPQRDERLGWTGDIAVFAPTASFLYGVDGFLRSWLEDLALEQRADGTVPFFVPELELPGTGDGLTLAPTAVWGDAVVTVPWDLYVASGDAAHLARQLPSMRRWVDRVLALAGPERIWDGGFQFGDWLDPAAPADEPAAALTETALVATAALARSTALIAEAFRIGGDAEGHARYLAESHAVAEAFRRRFVLPGGRLSSDTQTAYALALRHGLLDADARAQAAERLAQLVREAGHRIGTGFVGTPLVLHALSDAGALDDAYRLLLQTEPPSWLYAVEMGATTIWERWDSMLPDGSVNPGEMTSFNHYAFGAVAAWMHEVVGGLAPAAPGWSRMRVAPRPGGGLTHASAAHETPWGRASVAWTLDGDTMELEVVVPEGVTAEIEVGELCEAVGGGTHRRTVRPLADGGWHPGSVPRRDVTLGGRAG